MIKRLVKRAVGERGTAALRRLRFETYELRHIPVVRYQWLRLSGRHREHAPASPTKRVLFVTEKWCDGNPAHGLSNNTHNFFGSLEASGLAAQTHFHFDEYVARHGRSGDAALLQQCLDEPPDLLFLTWMPFKRLNPKLETLRIIRDMGIPIVAWWGDTVNPAVMEMAERLVPVVRFNIAADSAFAYLRSRRVEKYLNIVCPQDTRIFRDAGLVRDIGIAFLGSVEGYPDRRAGLEALRRAGLPVHRAGGQREQRLTVEEYARTYMRSKISLSFSLAGSWPQLKGHVLEATLCGSMVLESENRETEQWFEPMVDFVSFTSEADLVDKARYYLEHDAEREAIARRGHLKAMEWYTGERFWHTVFTQVFGSSSI